jgi:outer membrane lipoprotein
LNKNRFYVPLKKGYFMGRWILMSRPKINRIKLNRRDINIRQVYVTIRHIASESDENYKEISIMVLIFVDKDSNMNMTKGALILSLSFLLAACSSIPQNIKGNNQPDIQKSFVAVHNQPGLYVGQQARFGGKVINVIKRIRC